MLSEARIKQVTVLYSTIFDKMPAVTELDTYLNLNQNIKLEVISSMMMANSPLKSTLLSQDTKDIVKDLFQSIFGYTEDQMNTIIAQQEQVALDGGIDGFQYWVNELENNSTLINVNTLAIALLNGADEINYARAVNLPEVVVSVDNYSNKYDLNIQIDDLATQFMENLLLNNSYYTIIKDTEDDNNNGLINDYALVTMTLNDDNFVQYSFDNILSSEKSPFTINKNQLIIRDIDNDLSLNIIRYIDDEKIVVSEFINNHENDYNYFFDMQKAQEALVQLQSNDSLI